MGFKVVTLKYYLNEREVKALEELLPYWQQYKGKDGTYPFKDWGLEQMFQTVIEQGITHFFSYNIKLDQFRKGLIGEDEVFNKEGFRIKEEREKEVVEDAETKNDMQDS